jgi:autotransporter-associated beta strand protein
MKNSIFLRRHKVGVPRFLILAGLVLMLLGLENKVKAGGTYPGSIATGNWSAAYTWNSGALTGTATSLTTSTTVTGVGTLFNTELAVNDLLYLNNTLVGTILSIGSNTILTLTANALSAQSSRPVSHSFIPSSSHTLTINTGHTVTVDGTFTCAALTLGSGGGTASLTFSGSTPSLTVTGTVNVGGPSNANRAGIITFTSGSTLVASSVILNKNLNGTTEVSKIIMTAGGLLKTGSFGLGTQTAGTPVWTPGTGTVELTGTNTLPATIFTSFNNLTISAGTTTTGVAIPTVTGALNIKAAATFSLGHNVGATTAPTSVVLECGSSGSTIGGSGTLTLGGPVNVNYVATGTNGATISCPVTLGANRTFTVADNGSTALTVNNTISGAYGVTKAGAGTMVFSGANTYTGATTISEGILQLGEADRISNSSNIVLSGGTFRTGATTGYNETVGTLNLAANSTIALGTGSHSLIFANSSGVTWSGSALTITGWTGPAGGSGTAGKIYFGSSEGTLNPEQLTKISFDGYTGTPVLLGTGELVPTYLPVITGFDPVNACSAGVSVTIIGTYFTGATNVSFNGTSATIFTVVDDTHITATLPSGATTGKITVTGPGGKATSTADFTVNQTPSALVTNQTNITCYAANDGSITISASGGTAPYEFSVDNGLTWVTTPDNPYVYGGLEPNHAYRIKVRDSNGCVSK